MRRGFLRLRGLTRRRRRSARSTIAPRRKSARWRIVGVWNVSRRGNVSARAESACHFSQCPFLSPTEPAGRNAFYALEGAIHTGSSRRSRHDGMVRELRCSRARALFWAFCGAAWCVTVGAGLLALCAYATSPCDPGARSGRWPADSAIPLQRERPTLLLFLHPRCPCSRASLAELERVLASAGERVAAHVIVFKPVGALANWERTGLWDQAAAMPGVTVWTDEGGALARRFGAATSGQVLLYDASGALTFQGGITPSRGHQGDNLGRTAVSSLIAGAANADSCSPVFGCPLLREPQERNKDPLP
jgi:hypothetical protein